MPTQQSLGNMIIADIKRGEYRNFFGLPNGGTSITAWLFIVCGVMLGLLFLRLLFGSYFHNKYYVMFAYIIFGKLGVSLHKIIKDNLR